MYKNRGLSEMKYIENLTDREIIIKGMTIGIGPKERQLVGNEEVLDWDEVKKYEAEKKIRIVDDKS